MSEAAVGTGSKTSPRSPQGGSDTEELSLRTRAARQLDVTLWPGKGLSPFNRASAVLILASVLLYAIETEPVIRDSVLGSVCRVANVIILLIFATEYIARIWAAPENPLYAGPGGRRKLALTPFAVFDLIGFLPELLILLLMQFGYASPENYAALKVLRFARLFRMIRYFDAANTVMRAIQRSWQQVLSAFLMSFLVLYVLALLLFLLEHNAQPGDYGSVPRAAYASAVQLTTLKGAEPPITLGGKLISSVVAFLSLGVVALPAGIFANAFREVMMEERQAEAAEAERLAKEQAEAEAEANGTQPKPAE